MCATNGGSGSILCNEASVNNASGIDATGRSGGVGFHCNTLGGNKEYSCFHADGGSSHFIAGLVVAANCCDTAALVTQGTTTTSPNGSDAIDLFRATDAGGRSGTLIKGLNAANNSELFSIDVNGASKFASDVSPESAGSSRLGSSSLPFGDLFLGTIATDNVHFSLPSFTAQRLVSVPDGNSGTVLVATLTTTAAASDNVSVQGMTTSGHCALTATNSSAASNLGTTYVSGKTSNQITVAHAAIANMAYDILCTSF